jgi:two-component system LytT family response regulator
MGLRQDRGRDVSRRGRMRVLIVDDERLARVRIRGLLSEHDTVESIDEAPSVASAIEAVQRRPLDVVFLDIEMPGGSGFDVLDHLPGSIAVVFVTAFDEYAVRAFEVNAIDYLVKPVDRRRLAITLDRLAGRTPAPQPMPRRLTPEDRLFLPRDRGGRFVALRSVVAIAAAGSYTEVRTADGRTDLLHRTMDEWEEILPVALFRRVHRSAIVNLDQIAETQSLMSGGYRLLMQSGPPITVSRRQAVAMRRSAIG